MNLDYRELGEQMDFNVKEKEIEEKRYLLTCTLLKLKLYKLKSNAPQLN